MTLIRPAALDALEDAAVDSAAAERDFRNNFAREIERLETERRRAYRRFNFVAALVAADSGAVDREASHAAQRLAAADELHWEEIDAPQAEILDALTPLSDAVHDERVLASQEAASEAESDSGQLIAVATDDAVSPAEARVGAILFALAAFEDRFEAMRGKPFAELFDKTFPETPLVDF